MYWLSSGVFFISGGGGGGGGGTTRVNVLSGGTKEVAPLKSGG